MSGSVECFYGPDGVGKTTLVEGLAVENPALVVLHGTDLDAWAGRYPDLSGERLIPESLPGPEDILDKIDVVIGVSEAIARTGRHVKVDGHPAHGTAINVAAGLFAVDEMVAGTSMKELLAASPLAKRFAQLKAREPQTMHANVELPLSLNTEAAAAVLQQRIHEREGGPRKWDPQTVEQSAAQVRAAWALTVCLQHRGHIVGNVRPPIIGH